VPATNSGDGEPPISFSGIPDDDDLDDDDLDDDSLQDDTLAADTEVDGAGAASPVAEVKAPAESKATKASKPLPASKATKAAPGRATPKGGSPRAQAPKPGRYTPPIPKQVRRSPSWYPYVLLTLLVGGLLMIVLNYIHVLPGGTSNWYLLGGIGLIVSGLFMATRYH